MKAQKRPRRLSNVNAEIEARRLVRSYTQGHSKTREAETPPLRSGQVTPVEEQYHAEDYVPKPEQYRGGVLASLLKLQNHQGSSIIPGRHRTYSRKSSIDIELLDGTTPSYTPGHSPPGSGATTPTYKHGFLHRHKPRGSESSFSLGHLIASSSTIALPQKGFSEDNADKGRQAKQQRPGLGKRTRSTDAFGAIAKKFSKPHGEEEAKITVHIAETLARQKYLVKLCRALMEYGAPTHRLEEYMRASSRVLAIESQFLYIPGCMIISFDDPSTHTTEVKLVRTAGGVDLGKLRDTHRIYKEVVHDVIGVEEATIELEEVVMQEKKFPVWFLIFVYGIASVSVGPFAFQARLIDLPISFILGCFLGFLQLKVAPRSDLYANIFEIAASVITSFAARGFGSIPDGKGGTIFCFSALAQSSIALILPGYTVLCASLELQSRSIVAGSVRMVYAIIYSLFLGYGITIGTVMYGSIDKNATSATTCTAPMPDFWYFFFVPVFTLCLSIINQAKWKQAPVMLFISFAGYVVNVFSARRFRGNTQVSQTLGALCIGILANLYARLGGRVENFSIEFWNNKLRPLILQTRSKLPSAAERLMRRLQSPKKQAIDEPESEMAKPPRKGRVGFGLAAAAMLPAIFVQVPSGLAVSGSLVAGITSANQILNNATGTTTVSSGDDSITLNSAAFNVGYSVIQVAIGITVGLFLSAVLVYPFGKKRSGLFSF
ncbi:DUF1212-domain-containing protein [Tothia fuscella]|uniref:DUF1212-domain-containing protein n=1 Tax=Tothia fuscella TaxID=1048955 RepID=A0A9P4NL54_9PEZI|nr:DUF1212-domain-containing protein [Tothia fuscella]